MEDTPRRTSSRISRRRHLDDSDEVYELPSTLARRVSRAPPTPRPPSPDYMEEPMSPIHRPPPSKHRRPKPIKRETPAFLGAVDTWDVLAPNTPSVGGSILTPAQPIVPVKRDPLYCVQKLKNVLKLPKAHRWVFFEWFYSNLDRPLLLSDNEFRCILRESLPNLKTRKLTRTQWSLIRRILGKPRRCSVAFFEEERRALNDRRDKVRVLQAKRAVDIEFLRDLPDDIHIPMPLIIGTKVNARVRTPHDGLYTGVVDALDPVNNFYRITFEKPHIGTRSVPDYEVLSVKPQITIPLSAYKTQHKASRNLFMSPARLLAQSALQGVRSSPSRAADELIGGLKSAAAAAIGVSMSAFQNPSGAAHAGALLAAAGKPQPTMASMLGGGAAALASRLLLNEAEIYGGYPMKFLVMVTKLSKILEVKKQCVEELSDMNSEAEKRAATYDSLPPQFQINYLTVIVQLERLNKELAQYLTHVLQYANEIALEHGVNPVEQTNEIRARCSDEATQMIRRLKQTQGIRIRSTRNALLIKSFITMLTEVRHMTEQSGTDIELSCVLETMRDMKSTIHSANIQHFENTIESPLGHILSGMSPLGSLNAFFFRNPNNTQLS